MEIIGYKCFNKDLLNRYGKKFRLGKIYITEGSIKFGNSGNGFHLCKNMEDTFRYFDAMNENVDICKVRASGVIVEYSDDYYGYYDMYEGEKLEILHVLSRREIIEYALSLNDERLKRFLSGIKLTDKEIEEILSLHSTSDVKATIDYYQKKKKDSYRRLYGRNSD